jgi:hypothetical protein
MLRGEIIAAQSSDEEGTHIKRRLIESDPKVNYFRVDDEGTLWFKDHLVVPKNHELRKKVFDEAHTSKYSIHPIAQKCIMILKRNFGGLAAPCCRARGPAQLQPVVRGQSDRARTVALGHALVSAQWHGNSNKFLFNSISI